MKADILSSDILERQFGPTEVRVIYQNNRVRIVTTYVKSSGKILELSCVKFIDAGVKQFGDIHQAVIAGMSMGKAFKAAGFKFSRREKAAYNYDLPANIRRWFNNDSSATVVNVSILVGPSQTPYAEIMETYSSDVRWPKPHGTPGPKQLNDIEQFDSLLARLKI